MCESKKQLLFLTAINLHYANYELEQYDLFGEIIKKTIHIAYSVNLTTSQLKDESTKTTATKLSKKNNVYTERFVSTHDINYW